MLPGHRKLVYCGCRSVTLRKWVRCYVSCSNNQCYEERSDLVPKNKFELKNETENVYKWRTTWHEKEGPYFSALRTFYTPESKSFVLKFLQSPINLSPSSIKKWWNRKQVEKNIILQGYIPERNQILGNELAAAHFIIFRGGSIKFHGDNEWLKANKYNEYDLPSQYQRDRILEAIDCTDMDLHYEGLVNLRHLQDMKWLSLNGCENMDDWCMDRITANFRNTLVYLDLRNCPSITERGIGALYKMQNLKILYLDDTLRSTSYEMTCLMLQDVNPSLDIRTGED